MTRQARAISIAMLPGERRAVAIIALIAMCRMFGLFALLPVLSTYSARLDGATPLLVGLAVGSYGLTQALLQVPFGAASDRYGRMPVIVFGLLLFAAGSVLAAESTSIAGVIAGRLLQGSGAVSATLSALLADRTRPEVRTRTMALLGVGIGASFLLALVIGPLIAAAASVRALFWVAAAMALVAALLLRAVPAATAPRQARRRVPLSRALAAPLVQLDVFVFLLHAMLTATFVALPFMLNDRLQLPLSHHWMLYVGALAASLVGTVPLIMSDDHRGRTATIGIAVLLLLAGQSLLALVADSMSAVILALALFFAGFNFLEAGLSARLSILADGDLRGASLGVFSSCQFLGAFAGGLLGGQFLKGGHPATVFLVCALLALAWLGMLKLWPAREKTPENA